ncbi:MAG: pilus assembly PilX N-terminal domain-containing protein [Sedimentisphaerales bacterium]
MLPERKHVFRKRRASALIISMIFLVVFSALAVSLAAMSNTNVQLAFNQQQAGRALNCAHSGQEIVRYYLCGLTIPADVLPADRLQAVADGLQDAFTDDGVTNMSALYHPSMYTLTIPNVTLDSMTNEGFTAMVTFAGKFDALNVLVTGSSRQADKHVALSYQFDTAANPIFDYGIATKGPLHMQGNVGVDGYNESIEASVYIESSDALLALQMTGKSSIAGDVNIVNPSAYVDIASNSSVHGQTGAGALAHVTIGADMCDFPLPNLTEFEGYIQHTFHAGDPTSNVTLTNVQIPANTNPTFSGHATIRGIMYIRSPNTVSFTGNAEVHGVILGDGDLSNPSPDGYIDFGGTVDSYDVSTLSQEEFGTLTEHTGTFLLAPGFRVCFRGDFAVLNGVIAASGVEFHGNAGGTINGSVINYSDARMTIAGNTKLVFNRSGMQKNPAGFEPITVLKCIPDSYTEPSL